MLHQHQQRICNNNNVLVRLVSQYNYSGDTEFLREAYSYYLNCLLEKESKHTDCNITSFVRYKTQQFINRIITGNNKINRSKRIKAGQKLLFEAANMTNMTNSKYNVDDIVKLLCRHVQGTIRELNDLRALERKDIYRNAAEAWLAQRNNVNVDNALYSSTSSMSEEERQPRVMTHHHYIQHEDRVDRDDGWPGGEED